MGYSGKVVERVRARELRAQGWTVPDIAAELAVPRGPVSVWLRTFFDIDEARLRATVWLHEGLDIDAAQAHWASIIGIPITQFTKPYRASADPTIRHNKHEYGCVRVRYSCATTHRAVMGLCRALLTSSVPFRGSSIGRAFDC